MHVYSKGLIVKELPPSRRTRRVRRHYAALFVVLFTAAGVLLALRPSAALADGHENTSDWDISVGAGAIFAPEYMGSDDMELSPVPVIDIEWRDRLFLSTRKGLGGYIVNEDAAARPLFGVFDSYNFGGSVRYAFGRDEDDNSRLNGLGDIDDTAELGLFGELGIGPVSFSAEVYGDVGDGHDGVHGELAAAYGMPINQKWIVSAGPVVKFGSDDFTQSFFGVDSAQASRSAFDRYDADGGFYSVGVEAMSRYAFTENWSVTGTAGYSRLVGDAADSPITEEEGAFTAGAFVVYTF